MFERFTPEARQVVLRAQEHAVRLRHDWIGCEHLLLGVSESPTPTGVLVREAGASPPALEDAIAAVIGSTAAGSDDTLLLATLGIDAEAVRQAAEARFGSDALARAGAGGRRRRRRFGRRRCNPSSGWRRFTPKAKRALELSLREALRLKHRHLGVEHLALGLLARDDTAAWQILLYVGVRPDQLRRALDESRPKPA